MSLARTKTISSRRTTRSKCRTALTVAGLVLAFGALFTAAGQSGGPYVLDRSVTGNGGGESSAGSFAVTGTVGQALAGANSIGTGRAIRGGFWQPNFSPTAAPVTLAGRVIGPSGGPLVKARVVLESGFSLLPRVALTNAFGYFQFDDVEVGYLYVLSVSSKRYSVEPVTVFVQGDITELVLTAAP